MKQEECLLIWQKYDMYLISFKIWRSLSVGGQLLQPNSHEVCWSISTWPAEGTLHTSTLLREQMQTMQKHSGHPTSGRALQISFWNSQKYRKYGLYHRVSCGELWVCVKSNREEYTLYWSSAHFFPIFFLSQLNNGIGLNEPFYLQYGIHFQTTWLSRIFLFCICSSVQKPKAPQPRILLCI